MYIKISLFAFFIALIFGCLPLDDEPKFKVINHTDMLYDSMVIHPNRNMVKFDSIYPGRITTGRFTFDQELLGDGSYYMDLHHKGSIRNIGWGYYTNGASLDCCFKICVYPDTVIITSGSMY